jgi:hypothetical protein
MTPITRVVANFPTRHKFGSAFIWFWKRSLLINRRGNLHIGACADALYKYKRSGVMRVRSIRKKNPRVGKKYPLNTDRFWLLCWLDIQSPFWTRSSKLRQLRNRKQRKSERNTDDRQKPEPWNRCATALRASHPRTKLKLPFLSWMNALHSTRILTMAKALSRWSYFQKFV